MHIRPPASRATLRAVGALTAFALVGGCLSEDESATDGSAPPAPSVNNPPTISGNPSPAVTIGEDYSFTPQASDPDGDPLTFSIRNQPMWASFDSSTGRISGTPTLGDIGTFASIEISVSDGQARVSMSRFSVEVTQAALGSATLSWSAPTTNTDGTPLSDLVAYRIYYGTTPNQWSNQVYIDNPSVTTYVVDNLTPNTYYFSATSINSMGVESEFSNMASKTVN